MLTSKTLRTTLRSLTLAVVATTLPGAAVAADPAPSLTLKSPAFAEGGKMPDRLAFSSFGCTGGNVSPELQLGGAPKGTKSFALILHDPDAPTGVGFFHWIVYNIPAATDRLAEGAGDPTRKKLPAGAVLGFTDFGNNKYGGPCPPPGKAHHYEFTVYALDDVLPNDPTMTGARLRFTLASHTLATARLTGLYGR